MVYLHEEEKEYPTVFKDVRPCYNRHECPDDWLDRFDPGGVLFVWLVPSQTMLVLYFSGTLLYLRGKSGTKQHLKGSTGEEFLSMMGLVRLRNEHSVSVPTSRNRPPITYFKNFILKIYKY